MNQRVLCHFEMVVNEKYYQFSFQPGVVNFDDLDNALMAFKSKIELLKEETVKAQAELSEKESADQAEAASTETDSVS